MPGWSAVPLRTIVDQALGISATGAIRLRTAILFTPTETDNQNLRAAEIPGRVLGTWNPHFRFAAAIGAKRFAPGHERRFR